MRFIGVDHEVVPILLALWKRTGRGRDEAEVDRGMVVAVLAVTVEAHGAVVVSKPSPGYAGREQGVGPDQPFTPTVRPSNAGGRFGRIGYRVNGTDRLGRVRDLRSFVRIYR